MESVKKLFQKNLYRGLILVALLIAFVVIARTFPLGSSALQVVSFRTATSTSLSDIPMQFEIADTDAAREQGLGSRASVPDNYAMFFVFQKPDRYGFWMKDMKVPIDMIWLSDTGQILGMDESVATSTYSTHPSTVFYPPQPVKYVLETKAGFMEEHQLTVGMQFPSLPNPLPETTH